MKKNYLYNKLNVFFKENYSLKKFSKSIFDEKSGNKYLLPLFNSKMNHEREKEEEDDKKDENESNNYTYEKYRKFNSFEKLDELSAKNQSKDFNKKIINIYSKNKLKEKDKKRVSILFFPHNVDRIFLPKFDKNKKIINLSKFFQINKKENNLLFFHNNFKTKKEKKEKKEKTEKTEVKNNVKNDINSTNKENTLDNFVLESTKYIIDDFNQKVPPIKKKRITTKKEEIKTNNTININKTWNVNRFINKRFIDNSSDKIKLIKIKENEKDANKENDISRINKRKHNKSGKKKDDINKIEKNVSITKDKKNESESKKKEIKEIEKENQTENIGSDNQSKKRATLRIANKKTTIRNRDLNKMLNLSVKFDLKDSDKYKNENNINNNLFIKKLNLEQTKEDNSEHSSSLDIEKEEERLEKLKKISQSNNMILKKEIEIEEAKIISRIEKKQSKTMKLIYQYIKRNIREAIRKEDIKNLLSHQDFREIVDILKSQINKGRELANKDPDKAIIKVTDDEIVDMLHKEIAKEEENLNKSISSSNPRKSTYIPTVHLKGKSTDRSKKEEAVETEEEKKIKEAREKEKEKLKIMVNEMTLSNELRFHIQETNNKELRERFQTILSQIESYQNLNMAEYVEAIKNNYILLKEEMNKIISDKEMEDRINGFVSNLDIERNVLESKWNYFNNKLNIIDNRFHSFLEKFDRSKIKNEKKI